MAGTISSQVGLASGYDWTSLITQMIDAQKAAKVAPLNNSKTSYQNRMSAWQSFNTMLSNIANYIDLNKLNEDEGYKTFTSNLFCLDESVTPSNVLSVSMGSVSGTGTYSIEVTSLAQAEKISSDSFGAKDQALDLSGDFLINGHTVTLTTSDTLADVATKINNANTGVNASILSISSSSYKLLLESTSTGAAGITLENGSQGNLLQSLTLETEEGAKKNVVRSGTDAALQIDGNPVTSASNTVTGVIEGVTLSLIGANAGKPIDLSITQDNSGVTQNVSTLVQNINTVLGFVKTQNTYSASNPAALMGDSSLQTVRENISSAVFSEVSGNSVYTTLSSLGISFGSDGTLSLDTNTLGTALSTNRNETINAIKQFSDSVYDQLNVFANPYTGTLVSIKNTLQTAMDRIDKRIADLDDQFTRQQEILEKKFNNLEILISQSNQTKSWLTQQTAYMTGQNKQQ